jgi:hypothetical protein
MMLLIKCDVYFLMQKKKKMLYDACCRNDGVVTVWAIKVIDSLELFLYLRKNL